MASASCTPSTMGLRLRTGIFAVMEFSRADDNEWRVFMQAPCPLARHLLSDCANARERGVLCGKADADRDSGPDFELLLSRHRRGGTGLLQAGRPGCRARTRRSRRKRAGGSQGRQPRVSRLFVTPCRRRVPRVAWREASLCPVAGHVLVSGDALGPQPRPRRPQHREGAADRRGLLGRNGAAAAFDRARHRPGTRRCPDRAEFRARMAQA